MLKNKSVPKGYLHNWKYTGRWREKKLRKGLWGFSFKATKKRRAKEYGNFGKGTKGAWKINGIQYITKTGKGTYQTHLIGTKRPLTFHIKRNGGNPLRKQRVYQHRRRYKHYGK